MTNPKPKANPLDLLRERMANLELRRIDSGDDWSYIAEDLLASALAYRAIGASYEGRVHGSSIRPEEFDFKIIDQEASDLLAKAEKESARKEDQGR